MGAGDLAAQTLIEDKKISSIDYVRTLKFAGIGLCIAVINYSSSSSLELN